MITVILPTLNEEGNIKEMIESILKVNSHIKIIVCDEKSADLTCDIVRSFPKKSVTLIDRKDTLHHGLCYSILDGLNAASGEYALVMDSDFQHPPEYVADFIKMIGKFDLVIGVRKSYPTNWGCGRKLMSFVASQLANIRLFGKKIKDPMSNFFLIKLSIFKKIYSQHSEKFEGKGYKPLFDILKYIPKETSIGFVYYDFALRKSGVSKINKKHIYYYFRSLFW